jgi:hypothetical protein
MTNRELTGKSIYQIQAHSQDNVYANQDQYLEEIRVHPARDIVIDQKKKSQDQNYEDDFLELHISEFGIRYWLFAFSFNS